MYKFMARVIVIFLLFSSSLAILYCYNQPCPLDAVECDRDFKIINRSNAEVKIHCLDEQGEILKTHLLYKNIQLMQNAVEDDSEDIEEDD